MDLFTKCPLGPRLQGRMEGGQGDMSPSKIAALKNFSGICDIQSNLQHIFRVSGGFDPDPTRGSVSE